MPKAAVVFNPTKLPRERIAEVLDPALREAGWDEALWLETQPDSTGARQAIEAVEKGCDVVLAVGGDGTVRSVAEGLNGSGVPLALVPRGTGNLLAHEMKLSVDDIGSAIRTALHGDTRTIDLGIVDWTRPDGDKQRHAFIVIAGMGLDAKIMSSTDEELKKRVGVLAYVKAGALALLDARRMTLQFSIDGGVPRIAKVHTVLVGNVGTIARNVTLMPDASLDDGALDVVAARPNGPITWLLLAWRVLVDNAFLRRLKPAALRERDDNARALSYLQCRHIDLTLREPEEIQLDGDHFGKVRAVSIEVAPGALQVKVPKARP